MKYLVLSICTVPVWLFGQSPVQHIKFYTVEDLNIAKVVETSLHPDYYNKKYETEEFLEHYFFPWRMDHASSLNYLKDTGEEQKIQAARKWLEESDCFAGNFNPYNSAFIETLLTNVQAEKYPALDFPAIVVNNTNVRRLPSDEFCFQDIRNAGEGYPFDYLQQTSVWVGTPVKIVHQSRDGFWYFAITPYSCGWIKANDVGLVKSSQTQKILKGSLVVIISEYVKVAHPSGIQLLRTGTVLPSISGKSLIPYKKKNGFVAFEASHLSIKEAATFPMVFNGSNIHHVLRQLWGGKYSWGGLDGGRDCSSTIKDFLTPFGIWMPRNSSEQKEVGEKINLEGTDGQKKSKIVNEGIPFLTILYKRGHSMLYVGKDASGTPLIFHNVWGVKPVFEDENLSEVAKNAEQYGLFGVTATEDGRQVSSRFIIGSAVITRVDPESGFQGMKFDAFLKNLASMNIFVHKNP